MRQPDVVDEAALSGEEPRIFAAADSLTDYVQGAAALHTGAREGNLVRRESVLPRR
jgi:hypothetical protein